MPVCRHSRAVRRARARSPGVAISAAAIGRAPGVVDHGRGERATACRRRRESHTLSRMSLLDRVFAPSRESAWRQLAREIDGDYVHARTPVGRGQGTKDRL